MGYRTSFQGWIDVPQCSAEKEQEIREFVKKTPFNDKPVEHFAEKELIIQRDTKCHCLCMEFQVDLKNHNNLVEKFFAKLVKILPEDATGKIFAFGEVFDDRWKLEIRKRKLFFSRMDWLEEGEWRQT